LFRKINGEYVAQEAAREKASVDLKIFGGNFKIDRVLARSTSKAIDEVNFQMQEKIKVSIIWCVETKNSKFLCINEVSPIIGK